MLYIYKRLITEFLPIEERFRVHIWTRGKVPITNDVILAYLRKTPAMWFICIIAAYNSSGLMKAKMSFKTDQAYLSFLRRDWVSLLSWYLAWERESKITDEYFLKRSPIGLFMEAAIIGSASMRWRPLLFRIKSATPR